MKKEVVMELLGMLVSSEPGSTETPFCVDDKVFVKTVTYHLTGAVKEIKAGFIRLTDAAMIADSGRFMNALRDSDFDEVEPYTNDVWVKIDAITEFTYISKLPRTQK